ncbi:XRE family transcriptional regulator [Streptomyces sp. 5-8]|uniref:XRE family transcriptional regulator n=1 Tax=Streptomyces musisoli TaxID=2802280 RepID=A0ABS1P7B3_9ACTN|nr:MULTISPECIES: XRE family transcriptional regulator [Streptomyces]MBL1108258.1 XRE family transcriptional regulator [Streptomyces musisoli]MBY8845068.1 XRE family transcriptional regulator [Streptomyces sp. SP2-10]
MRHSAQPNPPTPPFNAPAARRLRAALGMGPEHVAYGMRASYGMPYVTPDLVVAWERGTVTPSSPELTALAGVLWCSPGELIGRPQTLREHRIARAVAPEDVAHAVGMELRAYLRAEESGQWRGNERQSAALAQTLDLALPDFVAVTGREAKLADLLHSAVTTRWQAYVRPVMKLAPLDKGVVEDVLQALHQDYQGHMAATLSWGGGSRSASESGQQFLDGIVENFWTSVESRPG